MTVATRRKQEQARIETQKQQQAAVEQLKVQAQQTQQQEQEAEEKKSTEAKTSVFSTILQGIKSFFGNAVAQVGAGLGSIATGAKSVLSSVSNGLSGAKDSLSSVASSIGSKLSGAKNGIMSFLGNAFIKSLESMKANKSGIVKGLIGLAITGTILGVIFAASYFMGGIRNLGNAIVGGLKTTGDVIMTGLKTVGSKVKDAFNNVASKVSGLMGRNNDTAETYEEDDLFTPVTSEPTGTVKTEQKVVPEMDDAEMELGSTYSPTATETYQPTTNTFH